MKLHTLHGVTTAATTVAPGSEQALLGLLGLDGPHQRSALVVLEGPPGSGRTRIARALAGAVPVPDGKDLVALGWIRQGAGFDDSPTQGAPFRAPHHTASAAAMLGGGATHPRPGEVSLAHAGCLLLDDLPEFRRSVVEAVAEVLDAGTAGLQRASELLALPARPKVVVATVMPCSCGGARWCQCAPAAVGHYRARVRECAQLLAWSCSPVIWATISPAATS